MASMCPPEGGRYRILQTGKPRASSGSDVKDKDLRRLFVLGRDGDEILVEFRHEPRRLCSRLSRDGCDDLVIVRALLLDYGDGAVAASARNV